MVLPTEGTTMEVYVLTDDKGTVYAVTTEELQSKIWLTFSEDFRTTEVVLDDMALYEEAEAAAIEAQDEIDDDDDVYDDEDA